MTIPVHDWAEWFTRYRGNGGHSWLQSVEYMYPVYNHIYHTSPPPKTLLEIGCGMGDSARALAILGYRVKAIDNDPKILDMATNHPVPSLNGNLHFELGDALNPPTGFDISTSFGIIEHVEAITRISMLQAMTRCSHTYAVTIPSPLLCHTTQRDMGEKDIPLKQLLHECCESGWNIKSYSGWGTPTHLTWLQDKLPPTIWRRLQGRGLCSLSFFVIGSNE